MCLRLEFARRPIPRGRCALPPSGDRDFTRHAGKLGISKAFAAPLAGQLADRSGPKLVIALGASLSLASWVLFGFWNAMAGLVVGVIVLDFGVQSSLVSSQHQIYAVRPEGRNRLTTIFMTGMFIGGAVGSAGATEAWHRGGWPAVTIFGVVLAGVALVLELGMRHLRRHRRARLA
jgi:predicted MFS family arabinose efflux permease